MDLREVSYCGLYCGNCFIRDQNIADLAQILLQRFKEIKFDQWAKGLAQLNPQEMGAFNQAEACYAVLQAWDAMRCSHPCQQGGGSSRCAIRSCCRQKSLPGCWACEIYANCDTLATLQLVNGKLNSQNIQRIIEVGLEQFATEQHAQGHSDFYK